MKEDKKKRFSNSVEIQDMNSIMPSRETYLPSHIGRLPNITIGSSIGSENISEAIKGKSVVKDDENNRILGITDNAVIEFDENIMKAVTIATQNILKKFKERVENGTVIYPNVMETLVYTEFSNAAFVDTPGFIEVKRELNEILKFMLNSGNPEYVEAARDGILAFFEASEENIIRGRKQFNVGYALQNSEEKEFLRAVFIAKMFEAGVFDYNFFKESGEINKLDLDLIEAVYQESNLFTPEEIVDALVTIKAFEDRKGVLDYYIGHDKRHFVNLATSEEIARYIIDGKISPREANKKLRIDDLKNYPSELLEEFLCIKNFPKGTEFIEYFQNGVKKERNLSSKLLDKLDRERFLKVVLSEKISSSYRVPYKSEDYINTYGKLNIDDMMRLHGAGKINSEDLIKLINFKSIQVQEPEEYNKMVTTLLDFYDLDTIEKLIKEEKVNSKFAELYNKLLTEVASDEQQKVYFEKMNKDLQERENPEESLTSLIISGLDVGKNIGVELSEDYIAEQFLLDNIQEKDMFKMYEDG